jgi:hypothetical protein
MHRLVATLALAAISCAAPKIPPTRPEILGVFPHGGQRGAEVDVVIRGRNLRGASHILSATPKLSADILSVDPSLEPVRHDFRIIATYGSTIYRIDVSDCKEMFEQEPNDDRQHGQPIEFPAGRRDGKAGDRDYRLTAGPVTGGRDEQKSQYWDATNCGG